MINTSFKFGKVFDLDEAVKFDDQKVAFMNVFENNHGSVSLLAFKAGQKTDDHMAPAEVMLCVLSGEIQFNMAGESHSMKAGECILMGNGVSHNIHAVDDSKLVLVKINSDHGKI